ncbi:hypothetical protein GJ697_01425 [Pseudoduganella sp. FT25W]|uniref:Uncharacterized protein n=1 Tax=Duganella alba TaxID=2666081 RepID=A0A6L5QB04_9BURK|nr:hypothetical protein [Duganella alba]MRX06492.1 hypothetical protein [Duganella alba]MRX14886.1 hypothetical protein [Duganella alba]
MVLAQVAAELVATVLAGQAAVAPVVAVQAVVEQVGAVLAAMVLGVTEQVEVVRVIRSRIAVHLGSLHARSMKPVRPLGLACLMN